MSGGPDSIALMHAAAAWSRGKAGRPPLLVATVDHGLRPEARAEAEAVGGAAAALGLPHAIMTWSHDRAHASQAAAREARYRLLLAHAAASGATRMATAHTLDDQAETILMRLADGSGLSGLAGMAPVSRRGPVLHLRPFLGLPKAALAATCEARGWAYVQDPANRDPRFARARWRAVADLLSAEGLTPERIARLGDRLRRADAALEAMADRVAAEALEMSAAHNRGAPPPPGPGEAVRLDLALLAREPDEIALRVLLRVLRQVAPSASHIRLERIEQALAALHAALAAGRRLRRTLAGCILSLDRAGTLIVTPEPPRRRGR